MSIHVCSQCRDEVVIGPDNKDSFVCYSPGRMTNTQEERLYFCDEDCCALRNHFIIQSCFSGRGSAKILAIILRSSLLR